MKEVKRYKTARINLIVMLAFTLCNVGLGALWSTMLYQKGYLFYLGTSLIKNLALWPVETLLLWLMFRTLCPVLQKQGLLPAEEKKG